MENRSTMKYWGIILLFFCGINGNTVAQSKPYFQQQVDTRIEVTLDDRSHYLRGYMSIDYTNNSSDTLKEIYFHLWPNAYSHDRTAYNKQAIENGSKDFYNAEKENWGFIDSLHFSVDAVSASTLPTTESDVVRLMLNEPLYPGDKINIQTPFKVQIPTTFSRLGHAGQSYQITQWFPKPAVYDKNGWNPMPYLDQGEFYSEFGSYDVSITLPDNYVVMSTGNLETPSEHLFLNNLAHKDISAYSKEKEIPSSNALKTIRFTENNIHDFAWFADKRWVVRIDSFNIPKTENNVIAYSAFYPEHAKGWNKSTDYLKNSTLFYSNKIGPYPYKTVKALEGPLVAGGGMEYPTVTIIIPSDNPATVNEIITHEVGHNWFYGILANNERKHPWLDESINSYFEDEHINESGDITAVLEKTLINHFRVTHQSQAVNENSTAYTYTNYGLDVYKTGAAYFKYLQAYLGLATFDKAMQEYYHQYKFKHVYPEDVQHTFEKVSGKDLSWFFHGLLNAEGPIDFTIKKVKTSGNETQITVKNKSNIKLPLLLMATYEKDSITKKKPILIEPFEGSTTVNIDNEGIPYDKVILASEQIDHQPYDNYYRNGSAQHLKIRPFFSLNSPTNFYKNISIAPALGYNAYDGFMLGALFHNISIPYKNFTYALAPMFGFRSKNIVGTGFLSYTQYTPQSKALHNIEYKLEGKSFGLDNSEINGADLVTARYIKIAPQLIFTFKKPYARSPLSRTLTAKAYWISEQALDFNLDSSDSLYKPSLGDFTSNIYGKLQYQHTYASTYNPYGFKAEAQAGTHFAKLMVEANAKVDYHYKNKALYVRGFVGKFFNLSSNPMDYYRYRLTSTYSAPNDYLYDHTFVNRSNNQGFWSHQMAIQEGGMKINTMMYANQLGMSDSWMGTINLKSDLPIGNLPIRLYADISTFTDAKLSNPSEAKFLWNIGFELYMSNFIQVYVPVLYSQDYRDYLNSVYGKNAFWGAIGFNINLNAINWSRPIESSGLMKYMK